MQLALAKFIAEHPVAAVGPALTYGAYVGNAMLIQRQSDPTSNFTVPFNSYTPTSPVAPSYEPDPRTPNAGLYGPSWGPANLFATTQRYVLDSPDTFAPIYSAAYNESVNEVWAKGTASYQFDQQPPLIAQYRRNDYENVTGHFWAYDGQPRLGTPPRAFNQVRISRKMLDPFRVRVVCLLLSHNIDRPPDPHFVFHAFHSSCVLSPLLSEMTKSPMPVCLPCSTRPWAMPAFWRGR